MTATDLPGIDVRARLAGIAAAQARPPGLLVALPPGILAVGGMVAGAALFAAGMVVAHLVMR